MQTIIDFFAFRTFVSLDVLRVVYARGAIGLPLLAWAVWLAAWEAWVAECRVWAVACLACPGWAGCPEWEAWADLAEAPPKH